MKRTTEVNINTPDLFNKKFQKKLMFEDMDRLRCLVKKYNGGTYVEVGCFDSPLPVLIKLTNPDERVVAIDFANEVVDFWKKNIPKIEWVLADAYSLPIEDGTVDYIVAGELIEHLDDPRLFIERCMSKLKDGGCLAISTPYNEVGNSVGGKEHVWAINDDDIRSFGFQEYEILNETIIAWRKK